MTLSRRTLPFAVALPLGGFLASFALVSRLLVAPRSEAYLELHLADLDDVAILKPALLPRRDADPVDVGAIAAVQVLDGQFGLGTRPKPGQVYCAAIRP